MRFTGDWSNGTLEIIVERSNEAVLMLHSTVRVGMGLQLDLSRSFGSIRVQAAGSVRIDQFEARATESISVSAAQQLTVVRGMLSHHAKIWLQGRQRTAVVGGLIDSGGGAIVLGRMGSATDVENGAQLLSSSGAVTIEGSQVSIGSGSRIITQGDYL